MYSLTMMLLSLDTIWHLIIPKYHMTFLTALTHCLKGFMRQSACLVVNQITVDSYRFLFGCTTVGQASDSMAALT